MKKGIIAKKIGMSQLFDENRNVVPVTICEAGPCVVVQKKTVDNDGYEAAQLGFGDASVKSVNKPLNGHQNQQQSNQHNSHQPASAVRRNERQLYV